MSSANRHKANRQNAQRSSGPRTDECKRRSSVNAMRHGLTTPRECSAWAPLQQSLEAMLAAEGPDKPCARALAVAILNYERNVQYQRERYLQSKQHGHVQAKPTRPPQFGSYGNTVFKSIGTIIRMIEKQEQSNADRKLRNADRHLRRAANQLIRQCIDLKTVNLNC
jgi:hypothetical protein